MRDDLKPLLGQSRFDDQALFKSVEHCLRFAFRHGSLSAIADSLGSMQLPMGTRSLTKDERPGQSGMILAAISPMTPLAKHLLTLRLVERGFPCTCGRSCCSGQALNPYWDHARVELIGQSMVLFSGMLIHYRMRDRAIRWWAGEKMNVDEVAKECGIHRDTVASHRRKIRDWAQDGYYRALQQADLLLRRDGVEPGDLKIGGLDEAGVD